MEKIVLRIGRRSQQTEEGVNNRITLFKKRSQEFMNKSDTILSPSDADRRGCPRIDNFSGDQGAGFQIWLHHQFGQESYADAFEMASVSYTHLTLPTIA